MHGKLIQPSIEILNIRIDEPITTITDLLLSAICLYAFLKIRKLDYTGRGFRYFKYYFFVLGLGAMTGGLLGHAFQYRLADEWKLLSWTLTLTSVALMVQALLEVAIPIIKRRIIIIISVFNIVLFSLAFFLTIWTKDFSPVKFHSIFGMVILAGSLCYHIYRKTTNKGVLVLMGGVGVGFVAAITFSFEWGISHWFNHRDVSHMILCFSAYYVYRGAVMLMRSAIDHV